MEEVLPPWASLATWAGLVTVVVLSLFKRWLVPRSHLEQVVGLMKERLADMEKRINDRDELIRELRAANAALDARNDMLSNQIRELLGVGRSAAAVVSATVAGAVPSGGGPGTGDPDGADAAPSGGAKARLNKLPGRRSRRR